MYSTGPILIAPPVSRAAAWVAAHNSSARRLLSSGHSRSERDRVEQVPVLGPGTGLAVVLLLFEALDRPAVEQRLCLRAGHRRPVIPRRPRVAFAQELAREASV